MVRPGNLIKRFTLSFNPMVTGWLAMIIFAIYACTQILIGSDTWTALACGRHHINQGISVDKVTVDPFSANSLPAGPTVEEIASWPKWAQWITDKVGIETVQRWHPTGWINQNWLAGELFYWLTHLSPFADDENLSFNSLVYLKFIIYIITVICLFYTAKVLGANSALAVIFSCFALFASRSFIDIRPAGFSNMLTAVYMLILVATTYRNILYIWLIVPLAVLWCNVHGGYIYIFIMLVPFIVFNLLTTNSKKNYITIGLKGLVHTVTAGIIAFLAMIIFNPFHFTNLTHIFIISISKNAEMWRKIYEWGPAFQWNNPFGSIQPFLVLSILFIGIFYLWLNSRFLEPQLPVETKNNKDEQLKQVTTILKTMGYIAAAYIFWVTFISFSLVEINFAGLFICIVFVVTLLLSVYNNIRFIYLTVFLSFIALVLANHSINYEGRYIFPFVILPGYVILHIVASILSEKIKIKTTNIIFVAISAIAAFFLMIIFFNPFIKTSFITLKAAWVPVYTKNIDYRNLIAWLYAINVFSIIIWIAIPYLQKFFKTPWEAVNNGSKDEAYQWPKINVAMIVIAGLSIYMAIRSRRFIPIAAITACPVLAMLTGQLLQTVYASLNFQKEFRFRIYPISNITKLSFIFITTLIIITLGITWGLKFKRVYLDPWPYNPKFNSIFMRMTVSGMQPFNACKFIRINNIRGEMLNDYSEGGFIAWAQEPDPDGFIPLKLFIDGRAQTAYTSELCNFYTNIINGGPIVSNSMENNSSLTPADYVNLGKWVNERLKLNNQNVWVVLMPNSQFQFNKSFITSFNYNPNWREVYIDDNHELFVDITFPEGKKLFDGIFNGQTMYPDSFSKNFIFAHYLLSPQSNNELIKQGLKYAIKAFNAYYSHIVLQKIIDAVKFPVIKNDIDEFCMDYLSTFVNNKALWSKQHGYYIKVLSAVKVSEYLKESAFQQKNPDLAMLYEAKKQECNEELNLFNDIKW